jgi:23S rRNA (uracil1939-C5)-methyltransferase
MAEPDEKSRDEATRLSIERIVSGGDGMAHGPDGCVVFVPRTAPGDVVEVEYTLEQRHWRRARVVRMVTPGADRSEPPCPYYPRCGGCQLQHLRYEAQLEVKSAIVIDCLRRLGKVTLSSLAVEPSPNRLAYRNRISLVVRGRGAGIVAGYHALNDTDEVVDITTCPLAERPINDAWASLHEKLRDVTVPGRADARLTLRATSEGQVGLAIETTRGGLAVSDGVVDIAGLDAVWWVDTRGRVAAGAGKEHLSERWGPYEIPLAGTAFLQVNREASALLDDHVAEQCLGAQGRRVVDAYCGFGLRALELARNGAIVTGIDVDRSSIEAAARLAAERGLSARFAAATVERALASHLPADVVILNPPRRGVSRRALDALARRPARRIVYVSCDPATLARDIKMLGPQFHLTQCRAFDLFPQTAHVETVATLEPLPASAKTQ